jgi:oligoendopeptidase F
VRRYGAEGDAFVPRYLDVLAAGASRPPAELLSGLGIDPEDPAFWADGVALIAQQLDELEAAAHAAGLLGDAVRGQYT